MNTCTKHCRPEFDEHSEECIKSESYREQVAMDAAMPIESLERADCTCPIKTARKGWKCNTCGKVVS